MSFATLVQGIRHKKKDGIPPIEEVLENTSEEMGRWNKLLNHYQIAGVTDQGASYIKGVDTEHVGLRVALADALFKKAGGDYSTGYQDGLSEEQRVHNRAHNSGLGSETWERATHLLKNVGEARWQSAAGNPDPYIITRAVNELAGALTESGLIEGENEALCHAMNFANSLDPVLRLALPKIGRNPHVLDHHAGTHK